MAASDSFAHQLMHWDIDRYLNPWIPHNRLGVFPKPATRFLGYRAQSGIQEPPPLLQWPFTLVGTLAALCLVGSIMKYSPGLQEWNPPILIGSLGASCVLDFNAIRSPLAQPRNSIIGNTLSALVGVCIAKLFQLNSNFDDISWVAGALGCACASVLMSITNTVHPPGGATALLASINPTIVALGWRYVPLVILGSTLLVVVAMIFNNVLRQYPVFWWTPSPCGKQLRQKQQSDKQIEEGDNALKRTVSNTSSELTLGTDGKDSMDKQHVEFAAKIDTIKITAHEIQLPAVIELSQEEATLLESLRLRLVGPRSS